MQLKADKRQKWGEKETIQRERKWDKGRKKKRERNR